MPMETRHDLEHTTERLTEGLRCPWKWGHCSSKDRYARFRDDRAIRSRVILRKTEGVASPPCSGED